VFFLALITALAAFIWVFLSFVNKDVLGSTDNGLSAIYYNNKDFTGSTISRVDPAINFNWSYSSPGYSMADNTYSARWTGQLLPKYSETYTFYTKSDDGVRLWVNDRLLIDNWAIHAVMENSGKIYLTAGQKVNIKMEFYENYGKAVAKLLWSSPLTYKQIIPTDSLFPTATSAPAVTPMPIPPAATTVPMTTPTPTPASTTVPTIGVSVPFNQSSIWNKPIGSNPQVLSNSSQMIQLLASDPDRSQIILPGVDQHWSVVVGQADASTPRYTITDEYGYTIYNVPVPPGIILDPLQTLKLLSWITQFHPGGSTVSGLLETAGQVIRQDLQGGVILAKQEMVSITLMVASGVAGQQVGII